MKILLKSVIASALITTVFLLVVYKIIQKPGAKNVFTLFQQRLPVDEFDMTITLSSLHYENRDSNKLYVRKALPVIESRLNNLFVSYNVPHKKDNLIELSIKNIIDTTFIEKIISQPLKFEITEVYSSVEVYPFLQEADKTLAIINRELPDTDSCKILNPSTRSVEMLYPDLKKETDRLFFYPLQELTGLTLPDSSKALNKNLLLPFYTLVKNKDLKKLNCWLAIEKKMKLLPENIQIAFPYSDNRNIDEPCQIHFIHQSIFNRQRITKNDLKEVEVSFDDSQRPELIGKFKAESVLKWESLTEKNINRPLAMIIDGKVICSPNVIGKITGGNFSITGKFTFTELYELEQMLKAKELESPLKVIQKSVFKRAKSNNTTAFFTLAVLGFIVITIFIYTLLRMIYPKKPTNGHF